MAKKHLDDAYDPDKIDAIAGVRGWGVVLSELAALSNDTDPSTWYA